MIIWSLNFVSELESQSQSFICWFIWINWKISYKSKAVQVNNMLHFFNVVDNKVEK